MSEYLSMAQLVDLYAGVWSRWQSYEHVRLGMLPHLKLPGRRELLFPLAELERYKAGECDLEGSGSRREVVSAAPAAPENGPNRGMGSGCPAFNGSTARPGVPAGTPAGTPGGPAITFLGGAALRLASVPSACVEGIHRPFPQGT